MRLAEQRFAAEGEARVGERLGQVERRRVSDAERHPGFQRVERRCRVGCGEAGERIGLTDDEAVAIADPGAVQKRTPVDAGGERRDFCRRMRIVLDCQIAKLCLVPAALGNGGLERERPRCRAGRILPAEQGQQLGRICAIGLALRGEVRLQIIIAVGQAETGLAEIDRVAIGRLQVGVDEGRGDRRIEVIGSLAHERGELGRRRCGADGVEFRLDRGEAGALDLRLIHERRVESAGLATNVSRLLADALRHLLQQLVKVGLHPVGHFDPPRDGWAVGRDYGPREILAVGILEEVVAGPGRGIDRAEV